MQKELLPIAEHVHFAVGAFPPRSTLQVRAVLMAGEATRCLIIAQAVEEKMIHFLGSSAHDNDYLKNKTMPELVDIFESGRGKR